MRLSPSLALPTLLCITLMGCGQKPKTPDATQTPSTMPSASALFEEVAEKAGVRFTHSNGFADKFYFIESTAGGGGWIDYDNDGWLDIILVQSGSSEKPPLLAKRATCALFHNNKNGTFTEVTQGSGLDRDLGYGHGVTVGDYDNDGFDDLFITAYGGNHLLHNERGSGKFRDTTVEMKLDKIHSTGYATSAAFGDIDNDGKLDLYVCYYGQWKWEIDKKCADASGQSEYCSPDLYDPDTHRLYHNEGTQFTDISEASGITKTPGRGLAVAFVDYDKDGNQDIFVANDLNPGILWRNEGRGKFKNVADEAGCSHNGDGAIMAGMGIAIADYDHTGNESLYVSDFSNKINALFQNSGDGLFTDVAQTIGKGLSGTKKYLSFGCEFMDYDADGWADLLVNNGHVNYRVGSSPGGITYSERKQLFRNVGAGKFQEITETGALGTLADPKVGRGLAIGDYDNDGRLDALAINQNAPVQLFHNRDTSANRWVSFQAQGVKNGRSGIHARFTLIAGGVRQTAVVRGGSSYLSASANRVYFGLGKADTIESVEVRWANGKTEQLKNIVPNTLYKVIEGGGIQKITP